MLKTFPREQQEEIFANDDNRCTMCGRGIQEGAELHVEPINIKNQNGETKVVGGLTLCELHTFIGEEGKETVSEMFARLYEQAKALGDQKTMEFCVQVLEVYEKNDVNGHIVWER